MSIESLKKRMRVDPRMSVFDVSCENGIVRGEVSEEAYLTLLKKHFKEVEVILLPHKKGIVSVPVTDMRRLPQKKSELVNQATLGSPVRILREKNEWFLCQMSDGYVGWMIKKDILPQDKREAEKWRKESVMTITPLSQIKSRPVQNSETIFSIYATSRLLPLKQKNSWTEVVLPDKRNGFIPTDDIIMKKSSSEDIVEKACLFLQTPYLWGGVSRLGIDCSGLVRTVFEMNGYRLPRDTDMQYKATRKITKQKKADLFFFSENGKSITHVGICMGGTRFIHASGRRGMVCINDLSGESGYERFLASLFVGARRIRKTFKVGSIFRKNV